MRWSSSAVGCGAGYLKARVLEEVNLFQISTSSSVVIDGVIEPAFREFYAKFHELGEKRQNIVMIRCALRSFLNPNLNSDRDLSSDLLLPVCKLLIQSVVSTNDQEPFSKSLIAKTLQRRPKNVNGFIFSSGAYLSAKALGSKEETAKSDAIEAIAIDFATAARTRQGFTSLSPISLENDAYRIVAREFAAEALKDSLFTSRGLFKKPLWTTSDKWRNKMENRPAFKGFFYDESFTFWRKWYQGYLDGKPLDWELQHRVALIADDIWDAGPEAVAKEIARIEAEHLSNKLPLAEEVTFNEDSGKFSVAPIPLENAPLMAALMARISDEFEDALSGHNGLSETSGDGRRIKRATTRHANNPQQAELTLTTVAKSLRRQIHETSELPDSPDNIALLEAVEDGVRGIRANHPEVAANREQLAQQALQEITPEDRETLEKAAPVLAAISEGDLAKDFTDDIPELINDAMLPLRSGAPQLPGADASTRIFSRVSKMALLCEKGAKTLDSKEIKTVRLGHLVYTIGEFLFAIVQMGLRLLGVI